MFLHCCIGEHACYAHATGPPTARLAGAGLELAPEKAWSCPSGPPAYHHHRFRFSYPDALRLPHHHTYTHLHGARLELLPGRQHGVCVALAGVRGEPLVHHHHLGSQIAGEEGSVARHVWRRGSGMHTRGCMLHSPYVCGAPLTGRML